MQCAISEHDTAGVANMRVWVNEVLRLDGTLVLMIGR